MPVIIDEVEIEPTDGAPAAREAAARPPARPRLDPVELAALLRREDSRRERLRAD